MKIVKLTAENIKKLSVVEISPDGNLVQVTGKNGQGKSSVLDSIWYALGGTRELPSQPIRHGEETALIELDMGEYVITRKFTEKGSYLQVKNKEGAIFQSPQNLLDKMLGDLAFDPLEFSRMKSKEQFDRLRFIANIGGELEIIDADIKEAFDGRTNKNREVKMLESQIEGIQVPEGTPDELVSVTVLIEQIDAEKAHNRSIEEAKAKMKGIEETKSNLKAQIEALQSEIDRKDVALTDLEPYAELQPKDYSKLQEQVSGAEDINANVHLRKQKQELSTRLNNVQGQTNILTERVEKGRDKRQKLISDADMPVSGLSLEDGQIILNDIPLDQASTAEQLKVSVAIAMAANPQIRVLRIKDGSLLDDENMAVIEEMAKEKDFQIWIERVDGSGDVGIVMEDGHIKNA